MRKSAKMEFHDKGRTPKAAIYLAAELERLMALPLNAKSEITEWFDQRDKVQQTLQEQFPEFSFYKEVWHFFADADIRARDPGYRDYQHRFMRHYATHLREHPTNT